MTTIGTHSEGNITFQSATPIPERYLFGTPNMHYAKLCGSGAKTRPLAVITDSAEKANQPVNLQVMGSNAGTMKVLAGGRIEQGDLITSDDQSKAVNINTLPKGTYHVAGIALTYAQPGSQVEFTPTLGLIHNKK